MKTPIWLLSICCALCGCKVTTSIKGIPNFAVVDTKLGIYRGAEPLPEGWQYLASLGVTNVVKLDTEAESTDTNAVALGMTIQRFPFTTEEQLFGPVDGAKVTGAVNAIGNNTYIHCGSDSRSDTNGLAYRFGVSGGQDRTGLICGVYRVKCGWTKSDAEKEMKQLGFHFILRGLADYWSDNVK
jgi:hypothetical protein